MNQELLGWMPFLIFVLTNLMFNLALWLWSRAEARAEHRQTLELVYAIQEEMKDFHGRLCALEAKRIK